MLSRPAGMTIASFLPPMELSVGSGLQFNARLIENTFGDGYRQTAPDGLNAVVGTMNAAWEMLTQDQANYTDNFLRANVGRPSYHRWHRT